MELAARLEASDGGGGTAVTVVLREGHIEFASFARTHGHGLFKRVGERKQLLQLFGTVEKNKNGEGLIDPAHRSIGDTFKGLFEGAYVSVKVTATSNLNVYFKDLLDSTVELWDQNKHQQPMLDFYKHLKQAVKLRFIPESHAQRNAWCRR